ncbi:glycosyltransferase family 2 protein [Leuconostoc fallax]|uniref:Glycosyltransferase 2-like domain-containing protein n=1 Tax=Leuconostoc fallax TaxID=1251 RepID=A0A4R5NAC8_9LACO|nr:glycosyltransferase [Leuconostoc fallax]MBU7454892.1 glycosyltransferase family 2 protein [Leuconostoc fallax]TDG69456.1 hypothetical protein C5L23_000918 [Leuconostoc fallax]
MNKESISVIITTYERSEMFKPDNFLIKRAIQSVLDQTLKSEEIIIIVDGKSRYITSIVEEFNREDIIKIVQTQDKVGGNEARNIGIRAATGDIIALLDDDDEWLPEKLNKQILLYKSISEEQKIIFSPMYFGESKDNVSQISPYEVNENIANYVLERKGAIQTSTLLAPKKLFLDYPFTKNLVKHQDWDLIFRLAFSTTTKFYQTSDPLIYCHLDAVKGLSVSRKVHPVFSLNWINQYRNQISKEGYRDFVWANVVSCLFKSKVDSQTKNKIIKILGFHNVLMIVLFKIKQKILRTKTF